MLFTLTAFALLLGKCGLIFWMVHNIIALGFAALLYHDFPVTI